MQRTVFYISDGTGITVETLGHSLITQFSNISFNTITLPYINQPDKAKQVVETINQHVEQDGQKPIILATLADHAIRAIIAESQGILFEFFSIFLDPLANALNCKFTHTVGKMHSIANYKHYKHRMAAIHFALACDDGLNTQQYHKADLILMGASRTGKTPTCLYLAMQFGIHAANYPLIPTELPRVGLPQALKPWQDKLFGITIDPHRLHQIRTERRANSSYASLTTCLNDIQSIEHLYQTYHIHYLDTSKRSIEEISTIILDKMAISRKLQ